MLEMRCAASTEDQDVLAALSLVRLAACDQCPSAATAFTLEISMLVRTCSCRIMLVTLGVVAGCQTPVAAPGAASVRVTQAASDVASCTAVGNISEDTMHQFFPIPQNQTIGLGGNVILNTGKGGLAYRCPSEH